MSPLFAEDRASKVLELVPKGEADASSGLTREMYKCLRGDRKSIGFDRGANTSSVHGTPPPRSMRPHISVRKSTSSQPPHGSHGSHTSGFSTGPSQSRDVIQEDHGVKIPVVDLRDGAPPVPGSNLPNTSASVVPSSTNVVGRSPHPTGSGQAAQAHPSMDRVGTKKRTRMSRNRNSASRSADPGHAPASPPLRKSGEGSTTKVSKQRRDSCPSLPPRSSAPPSLPPDCGVSEAPDSSLPTSPPPFVPIPEDHPTHSLSPRGTYRVISRWTLLFRLREVSLFFYVPTLSRFKFDVR